MPTKRRFLLTSLFLLLALIAGSYILRRPILIKLGEYLVYDSLTGKADAIVVLAGQMPERALEAVSLYQNGFAPVVVLSKGAVSSAAIELEQKGVVLHFEADNNRTVAYALGVPAGAVAVLEPYVGSTIDEAFAFADYARRNGARSVIIVTSKTHTRRAAMIFRRVLNECAELDIAVSTKPSSYDGFEPQSWWQTRAGLRTVVFEYEKLLHYHFTKHKICDSLQTN